MKKYIYINDSAELQVQLLMGKRVEGVLFTDRNTGRLTFKAYIRQPRVRRRDKLIHRLEHGWVKESKLRLKVFESIPKELGTTRMLAVMDREFDEARDAVVDNEIDKRKRQLIVES